jgi:ubiquinone/menaquinone biosynthesis C-methylase UbiE
MLKRGSVLVSADISEEMIKLLKGRFEDPDSEYLIIPGNKCEIKIEELAPLGKQDFDLEGYLKGHQQLQFTDQDRMVLGCLANNECLPFKDGTFDCYIANLSLMLVDNYKL